MKYQTQKVAMLYFYGALGLFLAQVLFGVVAGTIYVLPNTLSVVIVRVTLSIPSAIFSEAYLSYIGLGIPLPMCSWGSLAQLGIENFRIYPYQLIIPAICISLTMLAFNMFGDGLRDAFDPRLRR